MSTTSTTRTISTRSTTRFPLLSLTPELLDLILYHLAPRHTKAHIRTLTRLLAVHPALSPLVRRRLFQRVVFILGDKKGKDYTLLDLVEWRDSNTEREDGDGSPVGQHIRRLLIRAPDAMETEGADVPPGLELAAALVPTTKTPQIEALELVSRLLRQSKGVLRLEVETRLGTKEEGKTLTVEEEEGEEEKRKDLGKAFEGLRGVKEFGIAVSHLRHQTQLLATSSPDWTSPYITAFQTWDHLTTLDLWRVSLSLPSDTPSPNFSLRILNLVQCEFGSGRDLVWLLGEAGGSRSSKLEVLKYRDIDFLESPESSSPLMEIFPVDGTTPSFAGTLRKLELAIYNPLDGKDEVEGLFDTLSALREVTLAGEGITPSFLSSLSQSPSSKTSLSILVLSYLPLIPISTITKTLSLPHGFPTLISLDIQLLRPLRRTQPWDSSEWELSSSEWASLARLAISRNRLGEKFTLSENKREVDLEELVEDEEGEEEEEEEEVDGDALFEPSSEPEGNEWLLGQQGRDSEEEGESDFE